MPNSCCIPGCKSNYGSAYTRSFSFPSDPELKQKWEELIPRQNWTATKHNTVCVKHFLDEHVVKCDNLKQRDGTTISVPRQKWILRPDAVPMIFSESAFTAGKCIIYQCPSNKSTENIKLFNFPKSEQRSTMWIKIIKTLIDQDIVVHDTTRICSEHFEKKYIGNNNNLLSNALPSIFQNRQPPDVDDICKQESDEDSDVQDGEYDPLALTEKPNKTVETKSAVVTTTSSPITLSPASSSTSKPTMGISSRQLFQASPALPPTSASTSKISIKPMEKLSDVVIVRKNGCIYPQCKHDNLSKCKMISAPLDPKQQMIWRRLLKHPDTLKYRTIDKVCSCHFITGSIQFGPVLVGNIKNQQPLEYAKQSVLQLQELVKQTESDILLEPCSVKNCTSKPSDRNISFYALPVVTKQMSPSFRQIKSKCRNAWLSVIPLKRENTDPERIIVCSDHFRYGKPADVLNYCHVDWVPTLGLGLNEKDGFNEWNSFKRNMGEWIFGSSNISQSNGGNDRDITNPTPSGSSPILSQYDPKMNATVKVVLENINPDIEASSNQLELRQQRKRRLSPPTTTTTAAVTKISEKEESITARDIIKDLLGEDYLKDIETMKLKRQKLPTTTKSDEDVVNTVTNKAIVSPAAQKPTNNSCSTVTSTTSGTSNSSSRNLNQKFNYIDNNLLGKAGKLVSKDDLLNVDNDRKESNITKSKIDSNHVFIDEYSDDDVDERGFTFANNTDYQKAIELKNKTAKNKELLNRAYDLVYKSKSLKQIECKLCLKVFPTLILYHNHFTSKPECHPDSKNNNFECSVCETNFTEFNDYVKHFNDHCQIRSYFCNECRRHGVCTTLAQLDHMRQHFPHEKLYICDLCDRVCHELNDLKKHINDVHNNIAAIVPATAVIRPSTSQIVPAKTTTNLKDEQQQQQQQQINKEDDIDNENISYDDENENDEINNVVVEEFDQREEDPNEAEEQEKVDEKEVEIGEDDIEENEEIVEHEEVKNNDSMPLMSIQIDIDGQINYIQNEQNLPQDEYLVIEYNQEPIITNIDDNNSENLINVSSNHINLQPNNATAVAVNNTPRSTVINAPSPKLGLKKNVTWGNNSTIEISNNSNSSTPAILFKCDPCNECYQSAHELQTHKIQKHKTKYRCKLCSAVVTDLEEHRKTHSICTICSIVFNSQEELDCHSIIVH